MISRFPEKKRGIFYNVVLTTVIASVLAVIITYSIIQISGIGNFHLGACIAVTCCLLITPPISSYCFSLLRQLQLSRQVLESTNKELEHAMGQIRTLSGMLPICSHCKKIRDNEGYWKQIESYIEEHSNVLFSHGLCEQCIDDLYGNEKWFRKKKTQTG